MDGKQWINKNVNLTPVKNKSIKNIQFRMWGSDGKGNSSGARVQEVYFNGLQNVNN